MNNINNILLLNNNGYSMVKQTQEQWLKGKYYATSFSGGLVFPNFKQVANSFGLNYNLIDNYSSLNRIMNNAYKKRMPRIIEIKIHPNERVTPQSRFGYPIEDSEPMLSRKEFNSNMIIKN